MALVLTLALGLLFLLALAVLLAVDCCCCLLPRTEQVEKKAAKVLQEAIWEERRQENLLQTTNIFQSGLIIPGCSPNQHFMNDAILYPAMQLYCSREAIKQYTIMLKPIGNNR
jgi:hypothetical protein